MPLSIKISEDLSITLAELSFTSSRSSGPGGQNVNKVATRVTLWFDVAKSSSLTEQQKKIIRARLATRVNKKGVLRIVSQRHRSQSLNRKAVIERFASLIRESLRKMPLRKKTTVTSSSIQRRLNYKKHRGLIKEGRSKEISLDD